VGFLNVLEGCRRSLDRGGDGRIRHLVYASSSSVYGANRNLPYSVHDNVDHPVSLYAATKKAGELMAHAYSSLYGIPCTGLRFFTVYGPWGRPDMSYFKFTKQILEGSPVEVYNQGRMKRDFTYIDDVVEGVARVVPRAPSARASWDASAPDPGTSFAPYRIYNIGNNRPVDLLAFVSVLEAELGKRAEMRLLPMQQGDVEETCADIDDLERDAGYRPKTALGDGIRKFVAWYREYYHLDS
jgi:UDP-glucuronate 4-epimerase